MTAYFCNHQVRIFDYPKSTEPLRDQLRKNREQIAAGTATEIEFVHSKKKFCKESKESGLLESPAK
jgi:hypothetical protein